MALLRCAVLGVGLLFDFAAVAADQQTPALAWNCTGCHGPDGVSRGEAVPSIGGMHPRYFFKVMRDFKNGERFATVMDRIGAGYSFREIRSMAAYFAAVPWTGASAEADAEAVAAGRALHDEHCVECHEDDGRYQDKEIPRLAGQWPDYLFQQLLDYRDGQLAMPQPDKMKRRLAALTPRDLEHLSRFYGQVSDGPQASAVEAAPHQGAAAASDSGGR